MKKLFGVLCGVILAVSGLLLTACGDPYQNMTIVTDFTTLEMSVGEERQLTVSVEGISGSVSSEVDLSPDGDFITVVSSERLNAGRTRFTLRALSVGEGSILITTKEGRKTASVQVRVSENIQSFSRNSSNAFIVREDGYEMNLSPNNLFNFTPSATSQTDLNYFYTVGDIDYEVDRIVSETVLEDEQEVLYVRVYTAGGDVFNVLGTNFTLRAVSAYNSSLTQTFTVDIIEDIEVDALRLVERGGLGIANPVTIVQKGETAGDGEVANLELVSNDATRANAVVELSLNSSAENVEVTWSSGFSIVENETPQDAENTFSFRVQTVYVGEDTLTITLKYADYEGYEVKLEYAINIVSAPNSISVNELEDNEKIQLYDNNYNVTIASVSLTPIIYSTDSTFTRVLVDFCDANGNRIDNWTDYLTLSYQNISRVPNENGYVVLSASDFQNNALRSPLTLLGKKVYDGTDGIYIRFEVSSEYISAGDHVQKTYEIEIVPGAEEFEVNYPINQDKIYLDLNAEDPVKVFDGFTVSSSTSENVYIGLFTYRYSNANYFTVEQVIEDGEPQLAVKITPLAVGSGGRVTIYLPNGRSAVLNVDVEASVTSQSFGVEMNDNIVSFQEDALTNTFSMTLMDRKNYAETMFRFLVSPTVATLYSGEIDYTVDDTEMASFECEYSNLTNVITFIPYLADGVYVSEFTIKFAVTLEKIEDFVISDETQTIEYTVNVKCYVPIASLSFSQEDSSGNFQSVSRLPIYNLYAGEGGVGYYYGITNNYSRILVYPTVTLSSGVTLKEDELIEYINAVDNNTSYYFRSSIEEGNLNVVDGISQGADETEYANRLLNFGSYNIDQNDLSLRVICNSETIASDTRDYWFSFNLNLMGIDYYTVITLELQDFTRLNSIGLYDYQSTIYLDDRNTSYSSGYFINPTEADCREFDLKFIPDDTTNINIISTTKTDTEISIYYNSTYGAGSGRLYFVPKDWYTTDEDEANDFIENSSDLQYITIIASNGTEEHPIYINSAEEFIEMASSTEGLSRHYAISTIIDFSGINLTTFGVFRGSIVGTNSSAGITNLTITNPRAIGEESYLGLFAYIEEGAYIENLTISGKLVSNSTNAKYIGLICGENRGDIRNVSVSLLNDTSKNERLSVNSEGNVYIGIIAGRSSGNITNSNGKYLVNVRDSFNVINANALQTGAIGVYVGGVVGYNTGNVTLNDSSYSVTGENDFTFKGNLRATNAKAVGGVAGINAGILSGLKTSGSVINTESGENVGGLAGLNAYIDNETNQNLAGTIENSLTRTYVEASNFVGGLAGKNTFSSDATNDVTGVIQNNVIQLTFDGELKHLICARAGENAYTFAGDDTAESLAASNKAYYYEQFPEVDPETGRYTNGPIYFLSEVNGLDYKMGAFEFAVETIEIDANKSFNLLASENEEATDVVSYLFYYLAENASYQSLITELNIQDFQNFPIQFKSPENINLYSGNTKILTFEEDGKIRLWGTGLVEITATSILNTSIRKTVYVYVFNYAENFNIKLYNDTYLSNDSTSYIGINIGKSIELNLEYSAPDITSVNGQPITDEYGIPIAVELVKNTDFTANVSITVDETEQNYISSSLIGQSLLLRADSDYDGPIDLNVTPKYQFQVNGNNYNLDFAFLKNSNEYNAIIRVEKGTTEILLNTAEISIEPTDEFTVSLERWITDDENDYIEISFAKVGETGTDASLFNILSSTLTAEPIENTNRVIYRYSDSIKPSFTFRFNYFNHSTNYEGVYYINFTAENGYRQTLVVNIGTQSITNITYKNYYDIDVSNFNNTAEPLSDVSPDGDNLLEILVYPNIADYDYIEITNSEENYSNGNEAIFSLSEINDKNQVVDIFGAESIDGGIRIPKSRINQDGKIYVKYNISSKAQDGSQAVFNITAYKDGVIQKTTSCPVRVRIKDGVYVTIIGKEDAIQGESVFVAKGLTYNLDVQIVGFEQDEVHFDSTNEQYASIRNIDGNFVLVINSTINYPQNSVGYDVEIDCYGQKTIDGRVYTSGVRTLRLTIVDYVILSDNIVPYSFQDNNQNANIVIRDAESETVNVSIGNRTDLAVQFVNGNTIEYNTQDVNIVQRVTALEQTLAQSGKWFITDISTGDRIEIGQNSLPSNMYYRMEYNTSSNLYSIIPLYINSADNTNYYLSFEVYYTYRNGAVQVVQASESEDYENFNTDFLIEAYQSGNENNEIPISNYSELMNMQAGAYYILVDDITLEEGFTPITTAIAGFNGNGHTITFRANLNVDGLQYVGLFDVIQENALVRNLKLAFNSAANTNITVTNTNETSYFGFLAGRNLGAITNCELVSTENNVYVSMNPNSNTTTYVAGLVGLNEGYISNSRVVTNLVVRRSNLAGLVGVNEGSIASSYVKDSNLTNESTISSTNKTAGLVVENGTSISSDVEVGGLDTPQILTSFVSGTDSSYIYADEVNKIWSNVEVSGFVYNNFGAISDCYSNVPINSQSVRAGFAFNNAGVIQNSYSTSTFLSQNSQTDYGFVYMNSYSNQAGTIKDCNYLLGNKNNGIFVSNIEGLQALTELDFSNQNYFATFAMSEQTEKTKGVWFYPNASEEDDFKLNGESQSFTYGRPELVAPNIIVNTSQVLEGSTTDTSTGEEIYHYSGGEEQGSKYNPYIITSAQNFEGRILETNVNNRNNKYYRFVKNIDYEAEGILSSALYKTTFIGDIEGNGVTISGLVIDTRENLNYGGLFAKVGEGLAYVGSIKNLNVNPKYINMPNTSAVGTVAGALEGGFLFNVKVNGYEYDTNGIVIVGRNAVGGVVGIALNTYKMYNVESSVSASATYRSINAGNSFRFYSPYSGSITGISYAGVIAGIIEGEGRVRYVNVTETARALGEVAGLYFGRIGTNSNVSNLDIELVSGQFVNAAYYGGVLAGEVAGVVDNITITGSSANFFRYVPSVPSAVGGVAGYMSNGSIQNVNVYVDLVFPSIQVVGGVVGEMIGGTISNAHKTGAITSMAIAGGIVGYLNESCLNDSTVTKRNVTIENSRVTNGSVAVSNDNFLSAYVGGIVGLNEYDDDVEIIPETYPEREIVNCYAEVSLEIRSTMYNGLMNAAMGGIVGASYDDSTRTQNSSSGIAIYNNDFKNVYMPESSISEDYQTASGELVYFSSNCTYTINIQNYRDGGQINVYYGGIIGLGNVYASRLLVSGDSSTLQTNNDIYYYFESALDEDGIERRDLTHTTSIINFTIWEAGDPEFKNIQETDIVVEGQYNNKTLVEIEAGN